MNDDSVDKGLQETIITLSTREKAPQNRPVVSIYTDDIAKIQLQRNVLLNSNEKNQVKDCFYQKKSPLIELVLS